jgi:hypothetical protein
MLFYSSSPTNRYDIMVNKFRFVSVNHSFQDLPNAMNAAEVTDKLGLFFSRLRVNCFSTF